MASISKNILFCHLLSRFLLKNSKHDRFGRWQHASEAPQCKLNVESVHFQEQWVKVGEWKMDLVGWHQVESSNGDEAECGNERLRKPSTNVLLPQIAFGLQ